MKGTILDFLNLAAEKPELAKEFVELATKYEFEFTDEVSDDQLESVVGGAYLVDQALPQRDISQPGGITSATESSESDPRTLMETMSAIQQKQHDTLKQMIANLR